MDISAQFLPYKNPWTETWHKNIGDPTPVDPDTVETPHGYLTHHQYTGSMFHVTGSNYRELFDSEDAHEKAMSRYLGTKSPEDYTSVVNLHGGNEDSALSALRIHNGRRIERERQSEMGAEYNAGFYTDKEYVNGLANAASEYPEIKRPNTLNVISARTVPKRELK
jgi:hypothetical protein